PGNNLESSTLSSTSTIAAADVVTTFFEIPLQKPGTAKSLTATATALTATSSSFNIIAGTASQLVIGTQPGTTVAGQQITPAVKVRALDALGNVATRFTGAVAIALGSHPGGSTPSGTTPAQAGSRVATFFVSLNK